MSETRHGHGFGRSLIVGLGLGIILSTSAWAQQTGGRVTGLVTEEGTGRPLESAQVLIDGTSLGVPTNEAGRYLILNVRPGVYTVTVRMIGYADSRRENIEVGTDRTVEVNFTLSTSVLRLREVVVAGVTDPTSGVKVPFAIGQVTAADLTVPQVSAIGAVQGRVAGATLIRSSGEPGSDYAIMLRTPTSINRNNAPMIVVDGVILGEGQSMRDFDGFDIESIDIIKGAAAASMYGSRAAAGVIEIRTLRGASLAAGETRFSLRTEIGREELPPDQMKKQITSTAHPFLVNENLDWVDAQGRVVDRANRVRNRHNIQDGSYKELFDHKAELFKPGTMLSNVLTMSQNMERTRFMVSLTDLKESGILKENEGLTRRGIRMNLDHRPRENVNLAVSGFYSQTATDNNPSNPRPLYSLFFIPADRSLLMPSETPGHKFRMDLDPNILEENPLYLLNMIDDRSRRSRFLGSVTGTFTPNKLPWLRLEGNLSVDRSDELDVIYYPVGFKQMFHHVLEVGQLERNHAISQAVNGGLNLRLLHRFGDFTLRNQARALIEIQDNDATNATGRDLAVSDVRNLSVANERFLSSNVRSIRSEGFYFVSGVDWSERFIGDVLVRRDGSSLFGPDDRWNTYYRAAGAYRLAQESWWPFEQIGEFKLRASIGTAGGRPNFNDRFETWSVSQGVPAKGSLGNRLLRPERATERELGLDIIFFERFSLQLTHAKSVVEDQLMSFPLAGVFGYSSQWRNAGTLAGNTYEATLEAGLISRPNLYWSANLNVDRSRNEITDWPFNCSGTLYRCEGASLGMVRGRAQLTSLDQLKFHQNKDAFQINDEGYVVAVGVGNNYTEGISKNLWGTTVVVDGRNYAWGRVVLEIDDEGAAVQKELLNTDPDFKAGFGSQLRWNDFNFGILLSGQKGGAINNSQRSWAHRDGNHVDFDQRGKPDELKKPQAYYTGRGTDYFYEDASHVKLREISVRYSLAQSLMNRTGLGLRGASFSLIGRNLYTWSDFTGWDPEVGGFYGDATEYSNYPQLRVLSLGIELNF